jgi:alkanesulfonate monooxygenase SsuD/methylene tetrahydromethanopterin reductase-like flavin-dependent oxidoreductase (luciferase family)
VAVQIQVTGGRGREMSRAADPFHGSAEEIAKELTAYAREGIGHVQLVLDPITVEAIEEVARALPILDRA